MDIDYSKKSIEQLKSMVDNMDKYMVHEAERRKTQLFGPLIKKLNLA